MIEDIDNISLRSGFDRGHPQAERVTMAALTKAIRIDIGGFARLPVATGPFTQAEIELARAVAQLHPLASGADYPRLILEPLTLLREVRERMRLGLRVDPCDREPGRE